MSACPFKAGETYNTEGGWDADVVFLKGEKILTVQHRDDGAMLPIWVDLAGVHSDSSDKYNLIPPAPPMKRVPLGPEDVPPGSVINRMGQALWIAVVQVRIDGLDSSAGFHQWSTLMNPNWEIKRPGEDWAPMWKEVPEEGGAQ